MYTDLKCIICSGRAPKHSSHLTSGMFPTAAAGAGKGIKVTPPSPFSWAHNDLHCVRLVDKSPHTEKTKDF